MKIGQASCLTKDKHPNRRHSSLSGIFPKKKDSGQNDMRSVRLIVKQKFIQLKNSLRPLFYHGKEDAYKSIGAI
jgi:hypothetical protein